MTQPHFIQDRSPSATRSSQMIQCLRRHLLYADKRTRDELFLALERLLDSESQPDGVMLSRLTREAATAARTDGANGVNWDMAAKAVVNSMLSAGVLLAPDGAPLVKGIGAQAGRVAALKPGYRDIVESFLIGFLIREMGDIGTRDHKALAHALFRQFDPSITIAELEDRVVILLAALEGSVILRDDGTYEAARSHNPAAWRAAR